MHQSHQCPICPNSYNSILSLSKHWIRTHKLKTKQLYLQLKGLQKEPTCGCGGSVKFLDSGRGFSEYIQGHVARIPGKNNWGNNKTAFEKSLNSRRKMWENGEIKSWNKGLTKATDERVPLGGLKGSNTVRNDPTELRIRSERMKANRLNGTIPTLTLDKHSQWKGGISSLNHTCRAYPRLYKEWKLPVLAKSQFACVECGSKNNLQAHHDKERFAVILRKLAEQFGWEQALTKYINPDHKELLDLKFQICEAVVNYHVQHSVSGVALCENCHKALHPNLNTI